MVSQNLKIYIYRDYETKRIETEHEGEAEMSNQRSKDKTLFTYWPTKVQKEQIRQAALEHGTTMSDVLKAGTLGFMKATKQNQRHLLDKVGGGNNG
jgi:hypothetical protein